MKLTFSQSIILACVASSALTAAVPAFPLEAREPRRVSHKKVTDVTAAATDATAAYTSPNLVGRSIEDDLLVEREPARGRGRGRARSRGPSQNARNAAQGVGAFVGAAGAQHLNQQQNQNAGADPNVAARSIDLDEFDIETRDFEDDLIFERSPKRGGKGRGRSRSRGPSQNSRQAAQGVGAFVGAVGAQQINQQNTQDNAARSLDVDEFSVEAREFDDDPLWERAPITGAERVKRWRKRHPRYSSLSRHPGAGAGGVASSTNSGNSDGASNMATRDFDDYLLVERSPKKGKGSRKNKKKAAHLDDGDSVASDVTTGLQSRDFGDDLLFERSPKGGKGGKGRGRARSHAHNAGSIITEAAGAAGAEAAANLQTRDFEDDLIFERSPKGGKGGKGRGRARSHAHNAGSIIGEAAGAAGAEAAANLQTRDFEDDLLFERAPKGGKGGKGGKGRGRARSHAHNAGSVIAEAAGAAGAEAAANLQTRGFWEALVQRSPKGGKGGKGRGRARSHAHNAGSVIAEAAGAAGAEAAANLQTREFEDDLIFERSPKGGKGGKGRGRARSHAHNAGSIITEAAGAAGAEAAANLQTREFEDDLLFERSPKGGKGGKGRGRARSHAHNAGSIITEAAGAAGAEAAANLQTR